MLKRRPTTEEFAPYYGGYISQVEGEDILSILEQNKRATEDFLIDIPDKKWNFSYGHDKWTIKEVILHLIDTERVFSYRAMRIARGDTTALPGFDQDVFVKNSQANRRSIGTLISEFMVTRQATIFMYKNFSEEQWQMKGSASGVVWTPIGSAYATAGHENHHLRIIKERYL